ncbi:hypothetical protein K1T71_014078 [Dendrolimus kikuchii]|uniref:Uncharacterized protein n=1 Tax=Dendrolimus kikuchii TaxID=765133 RepID=A0ACC1CEX1_9NEOP|nr:hypothetical protein K1T71_014078 [Dendrolimus kikuchii]
MLKQNENSSMFDATILSLPNDYLNNSDNSTNDQIKILNNDLQIAHQEIENLNMEILELKSELQKSLKIIDTLKKINIIEQKGTTPLSGNKKKLNYVENRESLKISGKTVYTDPESVAHTIMPVMCNTKTAPIKVINLTSTMDGCLRTEDVVIDNVTDRITTKENDCTKLEDIISKENINRKIMIVADDLGKNMQRNIQKLVGKEFFVSCFWKPGANMHEVLLSEKTEICKLNKNDFVIILAGTNDRNPRDFQFWVQHFLNDVTNTNVIFLSIPYNKHLHEGKLNHELKYICRKNSAHFVNLDRSAYIPGQELARQQNVEICNVPERRGENIFKITDTV